MDSRLLAEPVIGPATSGRTRWLAYGGLNAIAKDVDGRNKSGHDDYLPFP